MKILGILGGGQLGRMLTEAAHNLGVSVVVLDPTENCPAAQVGARQIVGSFKDREKIIQLGKQCDVLTIEIEHVNTDALQEVCDYGIAVVYPRPHSIATVQDKLYQRLILSRLGNVPIPHFLPIGDSKSARNLVGWAGPLMLKTRRGGYDGRGNRAVCTKEEAGEVYSALRQQSSVYAEELLNIKKELSVVAASDITGNIQTYPMVEMEHTKTHICDWVVEPADISVEVRNEAKAIARRILYALRDVGVFTIEFILTEGDKLYVNEIAPRVHNTGHLTIEACNPSQFEQHIRAVMGHSVKRPGKLTPAAAMVNILGERNGKANPQGVERARDLPGVHVHIYGKAETKVGRKMGHVTAIEEYREDALAAAMRARGMITI